MADDKLFDRDDDSPADTKSDTSKDTQTPSGVSQEDFERSMKSLRDDLSNTLKSFGEQIGTSIQGLKPKDPDPEPVSLTDKQQALLTDPDSYIANVSKEVARSQDSGELTILLRDRQNAILRESKSAFDQKFGEGSWDDHMKDDIQAVLENMSPAMRSSEAHVQIAVKGLIGEKFDDLVDKHTEVQTRAKETPSMMTGPGRARPRTPTLTPEEKQYLADLERAGISYPEKQYLVDRDAGETEEDFPAPLEKS